MEECYTLDDGFPSPATLLNILKYNGQCDTVMDLIKQPIFDAPVILPYILKVNVTDLI